MSRQPLVPIAVLLLLYPVLDQVLGLHVVNPACQILIYAMLAQGLNIVVGFAGLLHLGYAAFFAVGAFTMAYLTSPQSPLAMNWPFWPALLASCALTTLVGLALAAPVLKLRGDYLAIVTMGFGLMIDPILRNYDEYTKAITGLSAVAPPSLGSMHLDSNNATGWYYFLLVCLAGCVLLCHRLRHSRLGRELRAQREDAIAATACGISVVAVKAQAFALGALIAGFAGALYASRIGTLNISFPLDFNGSIMILAMVILGGVGSIEGALVGGLALGTLNSILTPTLIDFINRHWKPVLAEHLQGYTSLWGFLEPLLDLSKAQYLIFGGTLVTMMLLRPQGLVPEQRVRYGERKA
jgi:branched-chain amino acid transport system permease protein